MKPQPPVFHIPIGYRRDESGTVVMFVNDDEQRAATDGWMEHLLQHPAAIAAGALIIVGPNQRQYIDLQAQSVVISKAGPDEWEPSAISDPQHTEERVP